MKRSESGFLKISGPYFYSELHGTNEPLSLFAPQIIFPGAISLRFIAVAGSSLTSCRSKARQRMSPPHVLQIQGFLPLRFGSGSSSTMIS